MTACVGNMPSTGLLTIDIGALASNWMFLNEYMTQQNPSAICAAVIKADAYGLGAQRVAKSLFSSGCRVFFTATIDEAVDVRGVVGPLAKIVVLGGLSHGTGDDWYRYQLMPMLFDVSDFVVWNDYVDSCGKALPCVIKIDTGMHRLGLSINEYQRLCASSELGDNINPWLVMSHLACSDEPEHRLNQYQLGLFLQAVDLSRQYFPNALYSLISSSGLFLNSDYHFDVARPGAAIYGLNPTAGLPNPMQSVIDLQLPIMQIKMIEAGESVGYGADFVAQRSTCLAIVFGGYGDGVLRALGNSGFAYCKGIKIPVVGRVSMDSIVFDITDIDQSVALPDVVELLGAEQSLDSLAECAGTIGYELLTSLGKRYKRRYINSVVS